MFCGLCTCRRCIDSSPSAHVPSFGIASLFVRSCCVASFHVPFFFVHLLSVAEVIAVFCVLPHFFLRGFGTFVLGAGKRPPNGRRYFAVVAIVVANPIVSTLSGPGSRFA
eukprot:RCo007340